MTGTDTGSDRRIMRRCRCGWEKVTTFRGVRIHQGRRKCEEGARKQHCPAAAGQTKGTQSQVANHRAEGSNVAEGRQVTGEGGIVADPDASEGGADNAPRTPTDPGTPLHPNTQEPGTRTERKEPRRRPPVKWPKANKTAVWQQLDKDLSIILEHSLHGQVETKLNSIGDILYEECKDGFGTLAEKRSTGLKQKGRREKGDRGTGEATASPSKAVEEGKARAGEPEATVGGSEKERRQPTEGRAHPHAQKAEGEGEKQLFQEPLPACKTVA